MKTNKFVIENRTELNDLDLFNYVVRVIQNGLISGDNEYYCYATSFGNIVVLFTRTHYGYNIHAV